VKRPVPFFETRIALSKEQQDAIRKLLKDVAPTFIDKAQLAGGEYQQLAVAWAGPTPAKIREQIADLQRQCAATAKTINSLADVAKEFVERAQAHENSLSTSLADLQIYLHRVESACSRATKFDDLNPGPGATSDDARHALIQQLGIAYKDTMGKAPATSSRGTFAKVARIVLAASGADSGLSNDLLARLLGGVR
jgi:hypothetical protein